MTFSEFYIFYLSQHLNKACRTFHFIGTTLVFMTVFTAIVTKQWMFLILCPVFGYGFSWVGHFMYERNKPAAFKYPLYSLISDFVMYGHILTNRLSPYLAKAASYK